MSDPDKPSQMQLAQEYLSAFCVAAVAAGFVGLVIATKLDPNDQRTIAAATLGVGFLGGLAATLVRPIRRFIASIGKHLSGL